MSYVAKAALFCDRCGARVDLDLDLLMPLTFTPVSTSGTPFSGWAQIEDSHHLCPSCAKEHNAKKAEMERELKEFAGIHEIRFDL